MQQLNYSLVVPMDLGHFYWQGRNEAQAAAEIRVVSVIFCILQPHFGEGLGDSWMEF